MLPSFGAAQLIAPAASGWRPHSAETRDPERAQAHPAELGRQVRAPQAALARLLLQRAHRAAPALGPAAPQLAHRGSDLFRDELADSIANVHHVLRQAEID
jgi:hypothetical protein